MSGVQLAASQYTAYDMQGGIVASRATRAHNISALSEEGPGICVVLRTGEELGNNDGIGVSLTITDDQLEELGYVKSGEQTSFLTMAELLATMPDVPADLPKPEEYAFCSVEKRMVSPDRLQPGGRFECDAENLTAFCCVKQAWVPLFHSGKGQQRGPRHGGVSAYCIDKRAIKLP